MVRAAPHMGIDGVPFESEIPMAKSYEQILRQIESLKAEADKLRRKETGEVVSRIRQAIDHYGLTAADLGLGAPARGRRAAAAAPAARKPAAKKAAAKKYVVAPKYRDDKGNTWSGRGLQPIWLREQIKGGKKLEDFAIK
jgi:DNA-binding protein H-NS